MKITNKTYLTLSCTLLLGALTLLSGCAAPPASNQLQQQVKALLAIQQQQARQLTDLKQLLVEAQIQLPETLQTVIEPTTSEQPDVPRQGSSVAPPIAFAPSAAEVAELSEAAGLYLEAFAAIATGQMRQAEAGFKAFIERFPGHKYSSNANYWRAEALLAQQKPGAAEAILLEIIADRQQAKGAAAMARLVVYYRTSGAQSKASDMLQQLSSRAPESPELKRLMRDTESR